MSVQHRDGRALVPQPSAAEVSAAREELSFLDDEELLCTVAYARRFSANLDRFAGALAAELFSIRPEYGVKKCSRIALAVTLLASVRA